jgi:hydrogenase maturation factor
VNLVVGEIICIREIGNDRCATLRVRGALAEISLDLVPEAARGDIVLCEGGVALSRLQEAEKEEF